MQNVEKLMVCDLLPKELKTGLRVWNAAQTQKGTITKIEWKRPNMIKGEGPWIKIDWDGGQTSQLMQIELDRVQLA